MSYLHNLESRRITDLANLSHISLYRTRQLFLHICAHFTIRASFELALASAGENCYDDIRKQKVITLSSCKAHTHTKTQQKFQGSLPQKMPLASPIPSEIVQIYGFLCLVSNLKRGSRSNRVLSLSGSTSIACHNYKSCETSLLKCSQYLCW